MNRIMYLIVFLLLCGACQAEKNEGVVIKGKMSKEQKGEVHLMRINPAMGGSDSITSAPLINGEFILSGQLEHPSSCYLRCFLEKEVEVDGKMKVLNIVRNYAIVLENQKDTVFFNLSGVTKNGVRIKGSQLSDKVLRLFKKDLTLAELKKKLDIVKGKFVKAKMNKEASQAEKEMQLKNFVEADSEYKKGQKEYILRQLKSDEDLIVKVLLLETYGIKKPEEIEYAELYIQQFDDKFGKDNYHSKFLASLVEKAKKVAKSDVGNKYLDFEAIKLNGTKIPFSSELGKSKYILLEFWASWCGPCRKEIPTMKKAYNEFHSKGFEIFSVSVDKKKEAWEKASKKEDLPWINTLIVNEEGKRANDIYAVTGVPANFLIDSDGTIIAKNLRGAALDEKLAELLNK